VGSPLRPKRRTSGPSPTSLAAATVVIAAGLALCDSAQAHVKWFAPYIVGAPPAPISRTITDPWFWTVIVLVLVPLMGTRAIERSGKGNQVDKLGDRLGTIRWILQQLADVRCVCFSGQTKIR